MKFNFKIKDKKNKLIFVFLTSIIFLSVCLFIFSSFFDIKINEFFIKWFKFNILKNVSMVSFKFGNFIIIGLLIPFILAIIIIIILDKYKNHKFYFKLYKNIKKVLVFWFIIYLSIFSLIIWVPSLIKIVDYYKKNDFSTKIDIKFLSTTLQTSFINIFLVLIIIIINFAVLNIYLIPQSLNKKIIDNNHIQPICVITIYIFICYLILTVLKHLSGRPFYMNVAWTRNSSLQSHLNPDLSIETYFKNKNWNFFNSNGIGNFSEAKYYEWWQANNTIKNWINWFNLPEKVWINYNDHYQDMDFPSGHIFSYTALFSTVYIFYFSSNYKQNKKFNVLQKSYFIITFILVIICAIGLMIQMFHWPSDISFSLAMSPILFLFSIYLFKLKFNKNNLNK